MAGPVCRRIQAAYGCGVFSVVSSLSSNQEEAYTKMILHAKHASDEGHKKILVKLSDIDVEVLLLCFQKDIAENIYLEA